MATILLNAVGFAVGGPIGAALGGLAGRAIDQQIFGSPKGAEAPRLKELDVQTSSYGSEIPAIFGAMRVAGTVIWATDLIERKSTEGGGKGRPGQTRYDYSVSFAVALSSRPALRVGRIWADGNLMRGAAGDFKVPVSFRFYPGLGDQKPDPLIAQAEGAQAPAFRGMAYALFEDLQLADYGNRIPSLTFELFERDGAVTLVDIAAATSDRLVVGDDPAAVAGFAASGSARDVVGLIVEGAGLRLTRTDRGFVFPAAAPPAGALDAPLAALDGEAVDRPRRSRAPLADYPIALEYRYYDVARDYQAGLQRARRTGAGRGIARVDFPAAMTADTAIEVAQALARRAGAEREQLTIAAAYGSVMPHVGHQLTWAGGAWTITALEHRPGALLITATVLPRYGPVMPSAVAGRAVREPDQVHGPTALMLAELPDIARSGTDRPVVVVAAAGASAGWRSAALSMGNSPDSLRPIGPTALPATFGVLVDSLETAKANLIHYHRPARVRLLRKDMMLGNADEEALFAGANMAAIGSEIVQFETAVRDDAGCYVLSGLRRGLFGSEAMEAHPANTSFLMLQREQLHILEGPDVAAGLPLTVAASGVGDEGAALASFDVAGTASLPLRPVHCHAQWQSGGLAVRWIRRSRLGADWSATVEPPMGEDSEAYRVEIVSESDGLLATWRVDAPRLLVQRVLLDQWRSDGVAEVTVVIRQIGRNGLSPDAHIAVSIA